MSHPDRYTEQFMAVSVVQPLLGALAYLHDQKITHRSGQRGLHELPLGSGDPTQFTLKSSTVRTGQCSSTPLYIPGPSQRARTQT